MNVGIVGHEAAKFTPETEAKARAIIRSLLRPGDLVVSGRSPLGGIDVWAEEEAQKLGCYDPALIFPPATSDWEHGFKPRNLKIAESSSIVHCIVVKVLPATYKGRRFTYCYHCKTDEHIKSGGCWTALRCAERRWWVIE